MTSLEERQRAIQAQAGPSLESRQQAIQAQAGELTWPQVGAQAVQNLPKSAKQFATDFLQPFMHPIQTARSLGDLAKGVYAKALVPGYQPSEEAANAVGRFFADRYGSVEDFKRAVATDPVGVAGDLSTVLTGVGAVGRAPGVLGRTAQTVGRAGQAIDPTRAITGGVGMAARTAGRVPGVRRIGQEAKNLTTDVLGVTSGVGGQPVERAVSAGYRGSEPFRRAMRGEGATPTELVNEARQAFNNMREIRGAQYRRGMREVGKVDKQIDWTGIDDALSNITETDTFKGVPINETTAKARDQVTAAVNQWRELAAGDPDFSTPIGLDALKRRVSDIADNYEYGTSSRMVVEQAQRAIRNEIIKQAPDYGRVMRAYELASEQLSEMERALSLGNKATIDTAVRKLGTIMRDNVNANFERRMVLAQALERHGATELLDKLAGLALEPYTPRGLSRAVAAAIVTGGGGAVLGGAGAAVPAAVMGAPLMSPRVVGTAAYGLGAGARRAEQVADAVGPYAGLAAWQTGRQSEEQR